MSAHKTHAYCYPFTILTNIVCINKKNDPSWHAPTPHLKPTLIEYSRKTNSDWKTGWWAQLDADRAGIEWNLIILLLQNLLHLFVSSLDIKFELTASSCYRFGMRLLPFDFPSSFLFSHCIVFWFSGAACFSVCGFRLTSIDLHHICVSFAHNYWSLTA